MKFLFIQVYKVDKKDFKFISITKCYLCDFLLENGLFHFKK